MRAAQSNVVKVDMVAPLGTRRPVVHVVELVGIDREIDIWTFVFDDVFESAPCRSVAAILGPDKGSGRLHIAERATILHPFSSNGTVFGWLVLVRHGCCHQDARDVWRM